MFIPGFSLDSYFDLSFPYALRNVFLTMAERPIMDVPANYPFSTTRDCTLPCRCATRPRNPYPTPYPIKPLSNPNRTAQVKQRTSIKIGKRIT
jgi:hypothetical protein